ncbi:MAG: LamG-like jellyroll fold domain-containing protein, partial [Vicinamibacterales bacterium]
MTDTLPAGLTPTAAAGSGWGPGTNACGIAGQTVTCTRSDALGVGLSYPAITLTVSVAANAPASVTNTAAVSGGGETNTTNNSVANPTTINPPPVPDLTVAKTHAGSFTQGQVGATYTITTSNSGTGPTAGTVTMTDTLPAGLTPTAATGSGWGPGTNACGIAGQTVTCTRSDALGAGASYPAVTLTVSVASNAGASLTNTAAVAGGGETNTANNTVNDVTVVVVPTLGLVAAYGFNEGTGTTVADLSGAGNTGTISGTGTWTATGKYGGALQFNGTNTLVTVANAASLALTTGMTVEAWVMPAATLSGWRTILHKNVDRFYLFASSDTNTPAAGGTFAGGNQNTVAPSALAANVWTHLAGTFDGATVRLYVNGVQVASQAQTTPLTTSTGTLQIGGSGYGEYFNGWIDELRVYNRARTALEIQQDMLTAVGNTGPDTTPPSAPTVLTATPGATGQLQLSWGASFDNVGVISYAVERCQGASCTNFAPLATVIAPATNFTDTGLTTGASYSYRVRASDAVPNVSPYSNTASATVPAPDTENPSAPGTLTVVAVSGTQINVSWGAATDNVGVDGYRLERCEGVGCAAFTKFGTTIVGTSFSDTSLTVNTSYSYIVRAQDAAGNLGPYSNVATTTTLTTNPNLVAAFSFDEGAGTSVGDASGHGHTGTITSATWAPAGKFGKALSFNGANALVTVADAADLRLTTGMTIEAWVNPTAGNSGWRDVVYKGNDNYYLEASTTSGAPGIGITVGAAHTEAIGAAPLALNTWTFLAATYDGATLRFYVNGTQVSSQPVTGPIVTSAQPLQIGGDSLYGQFFAGLIDEVRIYSVALTPGQILADMATGVAGGSSPALVLSASSVAFGGQSVGTSSAPQPVTVTNGGSQALNITSVTISGAQASDFSQTNNCVGSIAPSLSCTINVVFSPVSGGSRNATITIADNAPGNPHTIALSGTGQGFSVSPGTAVLTVSQTQQFVVSGGSVVWLVDGVVGGAAATGTVTASGLYTAPTSGGTHTVMARTTDGLQSAIATAYTTTNAGVFTHRNDNARTGQYLTETVLTLSNVNSNTFGKLASYATDGIAHASPLYVSNVNIPGVGVRNVVYIATEHDSVYAFDADGRSTSPLWHVSFLGAGITTVPNGDTGECCDIRPEIGITGTPVIDPVSKTLYVVAKTKEGASTYVQRLHALDIATGAEKFGGPVVIQASVPGTGVGSVGGVLPFDALRENQRTALFLHNGVVYFGFGSHGDVQPYHGWLLGYNATTLQQTLAFCATPDGEGGGIWLSGGGLGVDPAGNFYFATGDGSFDANTGGRNYGNTFLKITPSGTVLDYFTPRNQAFLDANNLDLDAGGMILLPDQPGTHPHLLVSAGKDGSVFLVDRDNMGRYQNPDGNVQTLPNIFPFGTPLPGNYSSPVYYNGTVYFGPVADVVQAFTLTGGLLSTGPTSTTLLSYPYPGGALSISANGTTNGILWTIRRNGETSTGTLHAYNASDLAFELYNSSQAAGSRDSLNDVAAKFAIPTVINGRVYVASEGKLTIFGLLP